MPKLYQIKCLEGIDWDAHFDYENDVAFTEFFETGEIKVGDYVTVENKEECVYTLGENEFCLTFNKNEDGETQFYLEEPFDHMECLLLFGDEFSG